MKTAGYFLATVLISASCVEHRSDENFAETTFSADSIEIKYAEGFEVEYDTAFTKIIIHSLPGNDPFRDSIYLLHGAGRAPEGSKFISDSIDKICCQSSTHLAYLNRLNALEKVTGLCGMNYVVDKEMQELLKKNDAQEFCTGERMETEAVLKLSPDILFTYPFGSSLEAGFDKKGIRTLFVAEYLEESQLARLEWIKLFGLLLGKADEATAYFDQVESEYLSQRLEPTDASPTFIMNLPFGDSWFMPSSKSVGVELIEDAGLNYFYSNDEGTQNATRSIEEVWSAGTKSDYWVIIAERPADFSLNSLVAENPVYREFKSVKNGGVFFCNTTQVDYFAKAVVEPHIVLKDFLFHTGKITDHEPRYFLRLEWIHL
jgi:iron complex transport system substrate-binding protein